MIDICPICKKEIVDCDSEDEMIHVDICYECETEIQIANCMELTGMGVEKNGR